MIVISLYTFCPRDDAHAAAERGNYAERTIAALFRNLRSSEPIWLHIADDGSAPEYREHLWDLAGQYVGDRRSISNSERRGYGGSYNSASHITHGLADVSALLQMEDDWILERPLDLDPLVRTLHGGHGIGCLRLATIGYFHPLRAEFRWAEEQHFLLLDPYSPSQYVFSGGPRLETVAWARGVGPWPEHQRAGETELQVCGRMAARTGVAWPVDLIPPKGGLFSHIGAVQVKDAPLGQAVTT